jgi:MoaA/NifB/PqqE/SkfB family radical SAM enzyme
MRRNGIILFRMANSFLINIAIVQIYKSFNIDLAHPTRVIAQLNNECNSKCNMCDVWRQNKKELPASVWITALKQLKSSLGYFSVGFAGGEILLKDDVFEILEYCHDAKLPYTITTNGKLLTAYNIERLLKLNPLSINISIDSLDGGIYRKIRGVSFLECVKSNIDYLMMYIKKNSISTKVFFKTVVNNLNLNELSSIANYAREMNIAGVTFDPIRRRREIFFEQKIDAFEKMANINMNTLQDSVKKLVGLKNKGINILNSEKRMKQWFKIQNIEKKNFCSTALRDIYIDTEGYVRLCDYSNSYIGNIADDDIRLLLNSETTKVEKKRLTKCQNPCDYCIHRNLSDYYKIFLSYLKN